jgi:hypothetical protein
VSSSAKDHACPQTALLKLLAVGGFEGVVGLLGLGLKSFSLLCGSRVVGKGSLEILFCYFFSLFAPTADLRTAMSRVRVLLARPVVQWPPRCSCHVHGLGANAITGRYRCRLLGSFLFFVMESAYCTTARNAHAYKCVPAVDSARTIRGTRKSGVQL